MPRDDREAKTSPPHHYEQVIRTIGNLVREVIPSDADVLVVTDGDDDLLDLPVRSAAHFPQDEHGVSAGHPADSADAIARLETLRRGGFGFLVLPATSLWWLDYYRAFGDYLGENYQPLLYAPGLCAVYRLAPIPGRQRPASPPDPTDASFRRSCTGEALPGLVADITRVLRAHIDSGRLDQLFRLFQEHDLHLTTVDYSSPIPDTRTLDLALWQKTIALTGIELREEAQLRLLREAFPSFRAEYSAIPAEPTDRPHQFHLNNGMFDGTDALVLYCMVRHFRPSTIVEVGSGYSSRLAAQAARRNGNTRLICIEPDPDPILRAGFPGLTVLVDKPVQQVDPSLFEALTEDDILFIDGSHVVRIGADVNYLFLEIMPRLRPGVIVHVHDVFFPEELPREWVLDELRFWTEQYLLQAFLLFNSEYEVLLAGNFLGRNYREVLVETFPNSPWWGGGSFWMRRRFHAQETGSSAPASSTQVQ